jgi:hypothetical protein
MDLEIRVNPNHLQPMVFQAIITHGDSTALPPFS